MCFFMSYKKLLIKNGLWAQDNNTTVNWIQDKEGSSFYVDIFPKPILS